jgi:hypothetical protein
MMTFECLYMCRALALMLNCTMGSLPARLNLQQFNYNHTKIAGKMFECMKNIRFRGVSVSRKDNIFQYFKSFKNRAK